MQSKDKGDEQFGGPGSGDTGAATEHACVITPDGIIVAVTPGLPNLLGRSLDQLVGSDVRALLAEPDGDCWREQAGERPASTLVALRTADGGSVSRVAERHSMVTDGGERVQLVRLTPPARALGTVAIDSDAAMIVVSDEMRIVGWTAGAEHLTGVNRRRALGRSCWDVLRIRELDGTPICRPECRLARAALAAPGLPATRVLLDCAGVDRALDLTTTVARLGGQRVLIHRLPTPPDLSAGARTRLTPRQLEVLRLLGEGLGTAEIASRLVVEPVTVKNHIQGVLQALGCHSRVEAIAKGRRLGLI